MYLGYLAFFLIEILQVLLIPSLQRLVFTSSRVQTLCLLTSSGKCGGRFLFYDYKRISVLVEGLNKFFLGLPLVMFASFLTDFGLIMELRVFSLMKAGDNLRIGISSADSSTMNSRNRVWSKSVSGVLNVICDFFLYPWVFLVSSLTVLPTHNRNL